jgi:hypothetical protein
MYHFPVYTSPRNNPTAHGNPRSRSRLQPHTQNATSNFSTFNNAQPASPPSRAFPHPHPHIHPSQDIHQKRDQTPPSQSSSMKQRSTPVTIVGFTPSRPVSPRSNTSGAPSASTRSALGSSTTSRKQAPRLSPPPMSYSYSSNPWILPGKKDTIEAESGSVDSEAGDWEFDKHLMRRINGNQPVHRFNKPTFMSSNYD